MTEYVFEYKTKKGKKLATLNSLNSPWKWHNATTYYRREFINLLTASKKFKLKEFALEILYNTKSDCDNMAGIAKFFVDSLRELKYVKDDTKGYYKYLKLEGDTELPYRTIIFKVIKIK